MVTDVIGGHATQHGFDAAAVTVVGEAGVGGAADGRQAVFGVAGKPMLPCFVERYAGSRRRLQQKLQLRHEVFDRHPGLFQDAVQCSDSQFAV